MWNSNAQAASELTHLDSCSHPVGSHKLHVLQLVLVGHFNISTSRAQLHFLHLSQHLHLGREHQIKSHVLDWVLQYLLQGVVVRRVDSLDVLNRV